MSGRYGEADEGFEGEPFVGDIAEMSVPDMVQQIGAEDANGLLLDLNNEKVLRSVQHEIGRAPVMEMTQKFVIILIDPGVDGGLDPERTSQRIDNWLSALTSAELLKATVSP